MWRRRRHQDSQQACNAPTGYIAIQDCPHLVTLHTRPGPTFADPTAGGLPFPQCTQLGSAQIAPPTPQTERCNTDGAIAWQLIAFRARHNLRAGGEETLVQLLTTQIVFLAALVVPWHSTATQCSAAQHMDMHEHMDYTGRRRRGGGYAAAAPAVLHLTGSGGGRWWPVAAAGAFVPGSRRPRRREHLGGADRWMGGWVARCGGGVGNSGISRGASRRANPRLAPRVRPHPPRGRARGGWRMGPEVGPALQRRSRRTLFIKPWRPVGGNGGVRHFEPLLSKLTHIFSAFAPRREPPRARAPGPQMIWMTSGSSLAFQRRYRATFSAGSAFRLAVFRSQLENGTDLVTDSQGVPDDVRCVGRGPAQICCVDMPCLVTHPPCSPLTKSKVCRQTSAAKSEQCTFVAKKERKGHFSIPEKHHLGSSRKCSDLNVTCVNINSAVQPAAGTRPLPRCAAAARRRQTRATTAAAAAAAARAAAPRGSAKEQEPLRRRRGAAPLTQSPGNHLEPGRRRRTPTESPGPRERGFAGAGRNAFWPGNTFQNLGVSTPAAYVLSYYFLAPQGSEGPPPGGHHPFCRLMGFRREAGLGGNRSDAVPPLRANAHMMYEWAIAPTPIGVIRVPGARVRGGLERGTNPGKIPPRPWIPTERSGSPHLASPRTVDLVARTGGMNDAPPPPNKTCCTGSRSFQRHPQQSATPNGHRNVAQSIPWGNRKMARAWRGHGLVWDIRTRELIPKAAGVFLKKVPSSESPSIEIVSWAQGGWAKKTGGGYDPCRANK
eukprot:gene18961-biopygen14523